ncbi:MAG: hypothetical protein HYT85_08525 [candidate division NC10 bacterium]|nr:hypothetical protein [candidate division NC10 bacterium]MBI2115111.1 hypothetical protein [candidate division NC10 bacterium]MBI3087180.1 hypothetical protein [candidate division NC10 bacterium]
MWTVRALLLILGSLVGMGAIAARPAGVAAAEAMSPQDALHQVMPGDDLHLIAGYYYGDARRWERIWQANRDQVPNPNRIERGILLRIPNAVVPAEPYADFLARARPAPSQVGRGVRADVPPVPEIPVPIARESPPAAAPASPTAPSAPSPSPAPRP